MAEVRRIPELRAIFKPGNPVIIFSHGFGVERTSAGLFQDIIEILPNSFGYVLFDYYSITGDHWSVPGINSMTSHLSRIIDMMHVDGRETYVLAHSQGCTIAALAYDGTWQGVFLAPPTRSIYKSWKQGFVKKRAGRAVIDDHGDVHMTRLSDQKKMTIASEWFEELVGNQSYDHMRKMASDGNLRVIEALKDESIKDRRRYKILEQSGAKIYSINANHNFDPPHRVDLTGEIKRVLSPYS